MDDESTRYKHLLIRQGSSCAGNAQYAPATLIKAGDKKYLPPSMSAVSSTAEVIADGVFVTCNADGSGGMQWGGDAADASEGEMAALSAWSFGDGFFASLVPPRLNLWLRPLPTYSLFGWPDPLPPPQLEEGDEEFWLEGQPAWHRGGGSTETLGCYTGNGSSYRGGAQSTDNGRPCQSWEHMSPHQHVRTASNYPHAGLGSHNFCRNPDGEAWPWCYTQDPQVRLEPCTHIPKCADGAQLAEEVVGGAQWAQEARDAAPGLRDDGWGGGRGMPGGGVSGRGWTLGGPGEGRAPAQREAWEAVVWEEGESPRDGEDQSTQGNQAVSSQGLQAISAQGLQAVSTQGSQAVSAHADEAREILVAAAAVVSEQGGGGGGNRSNPTRPRLLFVAEQPWAGGAVGPRAERRADRAAIDGRALSVLLLLIDATSKAHMQRMLPLNLASVRAMERRGRVRVYEFPFYSIVGYNSNPNMIPLLTGIDLPAWLQHLEEAPEDLAAVAPVWQRFKEHGDATFALEEIHDGCGDMGSSPTPSAAAKLLLSKLGMEFMPHHNPWTIFCQPELKGCCTDPASFLRPGRRQCVNGRDLHAELLKYTSEFFDLYLPRDGQRRVETAVRHEHKESLEEQKREHQQEHQMSPLRAEGGHVAPRRVFGLLNLMTAHEHFMHRLGALDADLAAWMARFERRLGADTATFLLADHGTHGIWYNDFAIGQAEHRNPALLLLLPAAFVDAHEGLDATLRRNTRRRVTAFDLHATLLHLAEWPAMPAPSFEATSLFAELADRRSCADARIPAEWCLEVDEQCFG